MFDKTAEDERQRERSSISLEDGADEWSCDRQQLDISDRGMCFVSRCQFPLGTQLAVTFSGLSKRRVQTEGIVVGCEDLDACGYRITVLFLDLPEESRWQLASFLENDEPRAGANPRFGKIAG